MRINPYKSVQADSVGFPWRRLALFVAMGCGLVSLQTRANGTDPVIVEGQVSFSTQGETLSITNSPGAIIHWQGFSIEAGETTNFIQQSAVSSVLNRVTGADPSVILGTLSSNGRVFLINPGGILVGQGAKIDVAGLVASTLDISNQDFLTGRLRFTAKSKTGTVENRGNIYTPAGGAVYLIGSNVSNSGNIYSPQGEIILAAGDTVQLMDTSTPGVRVEITASNNTSINLGELLAQSGDIGIYGAALQNAGIVNADQVTHDASGKIVLRAKQNITIEAGSHISANGVQGGEILIESETSAVQVSGLIAAAGSELSGGTVRVLGNDVNLNESTHINVSGKTGGGTVFIGGNFLGAGPEQNSLTASLDNDIQINADATHFGDGGRIAVWSDNDTSIGGTLTARGGMYSGNGGFIETSGKHLLINSSTHVNTLAYQGEAGTWLLDPQDFKIDSIGNGGDITGIDLGDALDLSSVVIFSDDGLSGVNGDILVNEAIDWNAATTLTLNAVRDVTVSVGAAITGENGSVVADAGRNISVNEAITTTTGNLTFTATEDVNLNAATTTTTGDISSTAGNDVNIAAFMTITTGQITATAGHDVTVGAGMSITTGDIVLRADNDGNGPGAVIGGSVDITCGSNCITVTGAANVLNIRFNPVDYTTTDAEILAYDLNLTGTGTLDARAWVFAEGTDKEYDGDTVAVVNNLKPDIIDSADPGTLTTTGSVFDSKNVGINKLINFDSYILTAPAAYDLWLPSGSPEGGPGITTADITPKALTAVDLIGSVTKIYDGDATVTNLTTANYSITGFIAGEGATVGVTTGTYDNGKDVIDNPANSPVTSTSLVIGDYTQDVGTLLSNYDLSAITGVSALGNIGAITPATLNITADNQTKTYGDEFNFNGTEFTANGLQNTDLIDIVTLTSTGTVATADVIDSPYIITPDNATGINFDQDNYTINYNNAPSGLTVNPALLTVTASPQTKVYGSLDPELSYTTTGLINTPLSGVIDTADTVLTGILTRDTGETVSDGPYLIGQGSLSANTNYTLVTFTESSLTITPAVLAIAADPQSKLFGTPDPVLGYSINGLVNNLLLGISDAAATVLTGALVRVPGESAAGGPYAINLGNLASTSNYRIAYTGNNLAIVGAAAEPVPGFSVGQIVFAGVINNVFYYRPGNFWHISLNPNEADPGFDVMRGTSDLKSRMGDRQNRCDSVAGGGYCETWSFPEQREKIEKND